MAPVPVSGDSAHQSGAERGSLPGPSRLARQVYLLEGGPPSRGAVWKQAEMALGELHFNEIQLIADTGNMVET